MSAYNLLIKIYFCKILEDKNKIQKRFSKENLSLQLPTTSIEDIIRASYQSVLEIDYRAIFETRFYDSLYPDESDLLIEIVNGLNSYDFEKISHDLLGKIYEQHIDKSERKDLGQYYTPSWIINYIFDSIPLETNNFVLDPACGSGGFLIGAYDRLLSMYSAEGFELADSHKNILDYNLFGFDINPFAVMLSAANLALRNIDVPTDEINMFELDSLIYGVQMHYYGFPKKNLDKVELENQKKEFTRIPKKYDVIVGNPPYYNINKNLVKKEYSKMFSFYDEVLSSPTNIISLFLARNIIALKNDGYLGFVVPKVLTFLDSWSPTREFILTYTDIIKIFDIREAFEDVRLEMVILILKRKKKEEPARYSHVDIDYLKSRSSRNFKFEEKLSMSVPTEAFSKEIFQIYRGNINETIYAKMNNGSEKLKEISTIKRGAGINLKKPKQYWQTNKSSSTCIPILRGRDVQQYSNNQIYWIDENYPIFDKYKTIIKDRKKEKLLAQRIVAQTKDHIKIIATYDPGMFLPVDTLIYFTFETDNYNPLFLLGILNSKLCSFYIYNFVFNRATRSMDFKYAGDMPIKMTSKEIQTEISGKVSEIINSTKRIGLIENQHRELSDLELKKIEGKKEIRKLNTKIKQNQRDIDKLLFSIYELNDIEIKHVLNQW